MHEHGPSAQLSGGRSIIQNLLLLKGHETYQIGGSAPALNAARVRVAVMNGTAQDSSSDHVSHGVK